MKQHLKLLADANSFLLELRNRSLEIDSMRQLPQDLAANLAKSGFYRLCTPEEIGGLSEDPATLYEVCETLAGANGSAAWCVFIGSTSQYLLGALAPEQQKEIMLKF